MVTGKRILYCGQPITGLFLTSRCLLSLGKHLRMFAFDALFFLFHMQYFLGTII